MALRKHDWVASGSGQGQVVGCYADGTEPLISTECGKFCD